MANCSVSSSCNDRSHHPRHVYSLVSSGMANLNSRDMTKQLLTPFATQAVINFSLKNYSCRLFDLIGMVEKVEVISTFATAVRECWNVTWSQTHACNLSTISEPGFTALTFI